MPILKIYHLIPEILPLCKLNFAEDFLKNVLTWAFTFLKGISKVKDNNKQI